MIFIISFISLTVCAQKKNSDKKRDSFAIAGIPVLSYNSSYGFVIGVNGMAFFNPNKKDTISPPSQAGIGTGFSQNRSLFVSVFAQLFFKQDSWRTTFGVGSGDINFQYFEAANEADGGDFVDYNSVESFLFLKALRKISGHFYGGGLLKLQHSKTRFDTDTDSLVTVNVNGIGISTLYDSRNKIYSPSKGLQTGLTFLANPKWMGSDSAFNSVRIYINSYFLINPKSVFAVRGSVFAGLGNVPFTGQHAVGGKDIRGYTDGKYRGNQEYSAQAEYRWNFYKRWGAVGFFGVAFTQKPRSGILPGGGAGIRFKAIPSKNINVGVDFALGKSDHGFYFRINEAF